MNIVRRLFVLALAVCAVMAMTAGSASAVEVIDEASTEHCTAVAEVDDAIVGGCPVQGGSNVEEHFELGGLGGLIMINCDITLEGAAGEDGTLIGTYTVGACENGDTEPCQSPEAHAMANITGPADQDGEYPIEADFCADPHSVPLPETHCHVVGTFLEVSHEDQRLEFSHSNPCEGGTGLSIEGVIEVKPDENHPEVELID